MGDSSLTELKVRGLAFWRPWGEAIVRPVPAGATAPSPKRIDNRGRPMPYSLNGLVFPHTWLAIYAAKAIDRAGIAWVNRNYGYGWTADDLEQPGTVLGVAQAVGYLSDGDAPWYFGPFVGGRRNYGWMLDNVIALPKPVPAKPAFARGLFLLPEPAQSAVVEAIRAHTRCK